MLILTIISTDAESDLTLMKRKARILLLLIVEIFAIILFVAIGYILLLITHVIRGQMADEINIVFSPFLLYILFYQMCWTQFLRVNLIRNLTSLVSIIWFNNEIMAFIIWSTGIMSLLLFLHLWRLIYWIAYEIALIGIRLWSIILIRLSIQIKCEYTKDAKS